MAINLADVGSGYKRTAINNNFQSIEDEINNNLLSKNGGIGLEADLDANSQKIINLDDGVANSDAVNLGQVNGIINAAGSGLIVSQKEVLLGSDAVSRVFTFTGITYVPSGNNLAVYRNGQRLETIIDYLESGTAQVTLTFDPNANDRFVFITNESTDTATTAPQTVNVLYERQVATAGQTAFTLTNSYVVGTNGITVYVNGILQTIAEYVETSNSVITFNTSLTAGDNVDFYVGQALISTPISTTGITHTESGSDYNLAQYLNEQQWTNVVNVKASPYNAKGDNSTDDTAAIQAAIDAVGEFQTLYFPPGQYVVKGSLDFTGKKNFSVKGEFRATRIKVDHTDSETFNFYNDSFTTGGTPQRGILIENISIYPHTTTSAMPLRGMRIRNCPEIKIQNCTLINCSSVASLEIDECWDAILEFNFISVKENLTSTHGAPYNTAAGGIGIFVPSECHAMTICYNRVRSGTPGISYGGGDATEIRLNAIESNVNAGITIAGSCQAITIDRNYFEGGQLWDIIYTSAGTNFSHTISGNYFHAVAGVKVETGCDCNNLNIVKNQFYSGTTSIELQSGITHKNIVIEDNLHREMGMTYDFNFGDFATIGTAYPNNRFKLNDSETGTLSGPNAYPSNHVMGNVFGLWQTFSGSGTASDGSTYHNGILEYDLTSGSSWSAFCQFPIDDSLKDSFITVNLPIKSSGGGNYTVSISDGVVSQNYTCNSGTTGAVDNILYFRTGASATSIQVRINIGNETIQALVPCVRRGLHNDLIYKDFR